MNETAGEIQKEKAETTEPVVRFSRLKSLSSRLLLLTIVSIMLIELFIFAPSVSRFRKDWFEKHLAAGELAALALEVNPDMKISQPLQDRLLAHAGAHGVVLRKPNHSVMALSKEMPKDVNIMVDVRPELSVMWLGGALDTFLQTENRVVRVVGPSTMDTETTVEVILDEAPMREAMIDYGFRILALSIVISLFTAAFVYLSLQWLMVRPMGRITRSMIAFRRAPEDETSGIVTSDREDEIGVAERELAVMQERLRTALKEQARLAALGAAVAKVNHDLRNSLASASLISDKLALSDDPQVRDSAPRLIASIDKAVGLCSQTLDFVAEKGKQMIKRRFFLFDLVEEAEALNQPLNLKLGEKTGETWINSVPEAIELMADPDQLVRAISNLARNAFEAGADIFTVEAFKRGGDVVVTLSDNGPGLPDKARENLFKPFAGSAKKGDRLGADYRQRHRDGPWRDDVPGVQRAGGNGFRNFIAGRAFVNQSMTWEPSRYLKFSGERQQPALDLMAAIDLEEPKNIVDLGCGAGGNAAILRQRFPDVRVTGVDSSAEMLSEARQYRGIEWELADIAEWRPENPVSSIFSNAALHWLPAHEKLFPRLLSFLEPGGVLAVQMPNNFGAPTHQLIAATATEGPWADKLRPLIKSSPVGSPGFYYGVLSPLTRSVRLWQTEYIHVLQGENPVADWTRGTAVKPFLDALEGREKEDFFTAYADRIAKAYPPESDGRTLLPFKRMFVLAVAD